jgi:hypothetical protein
VFVAHTSELARIPAGHSFVAAARKSVENAGHTVVEMADFRASDDPSEQTCRKMVASCDVFVGIVGFQYGSPVLGLPHLSYVELEFQVATELGLPRLMFLLGEETQGGRRLHHDRRYGDRQERFRARIADETTVRTVTTVDQLATDVRESLEALAPDRDEPPRVGPTPGDSWNASSGPLWMVPSLTGSEVARPEVTEPLVELLCGEQLEARPVVLTAGLEGAGGFGKTTVATLVCHDDRVRARYSGGIVWMTLGQQARGPVLAERINQVAELLAGTKPSFTDPEPAGQYLGHLLDHRRRLLVVDDVWFADQLAPVLTGGAGCMRLLTTRVRSLLDDSKSVAVDRMTPAQARQLLTTGLPDGMDVADLLDQAGGWPVLLKLVNRAIRRRLAHATTTGRAAAEAAAAWVRSDLAGGGPAAVDISSSALREDAVTSVVAASLQLLGERQGGWLDRYLELSIFTEGADIPLPLLGPYWGLAPSDVDRVCLEIDDLSLIDSLALEPDRRVLRLHDVIRDHLRRMVGDREHEFHRHLVDSRRQALPTADGRTAWWRMPREDDREHRSHRAVVGSVEPEPSGAARDAHRSQGRRDSPRVQPGRPNAGLRRQ